MGFEAGIEAIKSIFQGLGMIADGLNSLIYLAFQTVGISLPDWIIKVSVIACTILAFWKISESVNKIVLVILMITVFVLISGEMVSFFSSLLRIL